MCFLLAILSDEYRLEHFSLNYFCNSDRLKYRRATGVSDPWVYTRMKIRARRMDRFSRQSWKILEENMPAIASLEDLKAAQRDLLETKDTDELKAVFKKWRRIGWKNICKLWLEERTPEELKGESG
jgi:hypothetical protein